MTMLIGVISAQHDETEWLTVVRSWREQSGLDGSLDQHRIDPLVGERANGSASRDRPTRPFTHCFGGAERKQVLIEWPDDIVCSLTRVIEVVRKAADDRQWCTGELAGRQIRGCGDLVGYRNNGHFQGVAVFIDAPGVIVENSHSGRTDRDVAHS